MNDGQWMGKFPQNAGTAGDGMRETRMGADGHGWVCEGANECIVARGHEKKTRTVTNGRGWAETDTLRTRENRARNRYIHSSHKGERTEIWVTEGDGDEGLVKRRSQERARTTRSPKKPQQAYETRAKEQQQSQRKKSQHYKIGKKKRKKTQNPDNKLSHDQGMIL